MNTPAKAQRLTTLTTKKSRDKRAFLSPNWIGLFLVVIGFSYLAFSTLAPWQLGKNSEKTATNQRIEKAFDSAPRPVLDVVPADGSAMDIEDEWTHVTLRGRFLPEGEVVVRNRPVDTVNAYQMLTPFVVEDGYTGDAAGDAGTATEGQKPFTIVVNRGWVSAETVVVDSAGKLLLPEVPSGTVELSGFLRASEQKPVNDPVEAQGHTQVTGFSIDQIEKAMEQTSSVTLAREYVQLDDASVTRLNEGLAQPHATAVSLPKLDSGPHLGYGIQWIGFGVLAPAALLWFVRAEVRERRLEREERAFLESSAGGVASATSMNADSADATVTFSQTSGAEETHGVDPAAARARKNLADRYGKRYGRAEAKRQGKKKERF